jgi:hypothetical protein
VKPGIRALFLARLAVAALICSPVVPGVAAREGHAESHEPAGVELPENAVGLVVGGTYESEEHETFFTVGVEYSRELSHRWSFNFVGEHIGEVDAWVFAAPFGYRPGSGHEHPKSHFLLSFGPGIEHKGRRLRMIEDGPHAGEMESEQGENLFLFRAGVRYPVHFGTKYILVPGLDFDFVREDGEWVEAVVYDVTFAWNF